MYHFKIFAGTLLVLGALDAVWLGLVAKDFYKSALRPIARMSGDSLAPVWPAAALVYVGIAAGVVAFVLPVAGLASPWQAVGWGAAFGLLVFGVYDLTNYATLQAWTLRLVAVDMAWGAGSCAVASLAAQRLAIWLR